MPRILFDDILEDPDADAITSPETSEGDTMFVDDEGDVDFDDSDGPDDNGSVDDAMDDLIDTPAQLDDDEDSTGDIDTSVAMLQRDIRSLTDRVVANERMLDSLEMLSTLVTIVNTHGVTPGLYAFANHDGNLARLLNYREHTVPSTEGLLDSIKNTIKNWKHSGLEAEAEWANGPEFLKHLEDMHRSTTELRATYQAFFHDRIHELRSAKCEPEDENKHVKLILPIPKMMHELTGIISFARNFGKMTRVVPPTSREDFARYATSVTEAAHQDLQFVGLQINDLGQVRHVGGQWLSVDDMMPGTYAQHGYTPRNLVAAFSAMTKVVDGLSSVWASLIQFVKANNARVQKAKSPSEQRTIARTNNMMFLIAERYLDATYHTLRHDTSMLVIAVGKLYRDSEE